MIPTHRYAMPFAAGSYPEFVVWRMPWDLNSLRTLVARNSLALSEWSRKTGALHPPVRLEKSSRATCKPATFWFSWAWWRMPLKSVWPWPASWIDTAVLQVEGLSKQVTDFTDRVDVLFKKNVCLETGFTKVALEEQIHDVGRPSSPDRDCESNYKGPTKVPCLGRPGPRGGADGVSGFWIACRLQRVLAY